MRAPHGRAHHRRCHRLLRHGRAPRGRRHARVRKPRRHPGRPHRAVCMTSSESGDELELKARVDDPAALEAAIVEAGAELVFRGEMIDRRYDRRGKLEKRDEVLRLRVYKPDDGRPFGVLGWKGPGSVRDGYKHREEHEVQVAQPEAARLILERLRYEVVVRIDRKIAEYRLGGAGPSSPRRSGASLCRAGCSIPGFLSTTSVKSWPRGCSSWAGTDARRRRAKPREGVRIARAFST